ncbi:hypothetical protein CBS470a_013562 [Colletotrichum nupharicola]|nr:hypothetical protein CBS470a_013562 [Colletotrichum nupharicola]
MEPIAVYLQRMVMSHRASNSMTDDGKLLIKKTTKFPFKGTSSPCFETQPYFKLYQAASRLAEKAKAQYLSKNLPDVWDNAVDRRIAINEYLEAQSDTICRRNLPVTKWTVKLIEGRFGRWASRKRTLEQLIDEHPRTMAQWAIKTFGLGQFEWTSRYMETGPSISNPYL